MPRYRAKALIYIDRLIVAGEEFSSDDTPGRNWEPLDAAAKAKVGGLSTVEVPSILPPPKALAAVPDDWREMSGKKIIALATRLGAPAKGTNVEVATGWIERELAQRGFVPTGRPRESVLQEV